MNINYSDIYIIHFLVIHSSTKEFVAWPRAENCFVQDDQISYDSKEIIEQPQHVARIRSICGSNKELGRIAARAKHSLAFFLSVSLSKQKIKTWSDETRTPRERRRNGDRKTPRSKPLLQSTAQLRSAELQFSISAGKKAGTQFARRIFRHYGADAFCMHALLVTVAHWNCE